jgi:non-lysosomal glucosylceramidase
MYLAALTASAKMADIEADSALAQRYLAIRERGSKKQDETLFNGEYYIQVPGEEPLKDYNNGCHIDQVLGQWWANQLGLGRVYPQDHVQTALKSLMKYNFKPDFHGIKQVPRQFVADEDAGMQMITWPKGGRPAPEHQMYYADEVMSGFEYSAAAEMIHEGLIEEGFTVFKAAHDRYDGRLRTGLTGSENANWGYTGNPFGDDECGKFYARAMSVWGALVACQGFIYDGPAGLIGFRPVWKPEDHVSFFTVAEGYGLFTQKRKAGEQTDRIEVKHGKLEIKSMVFELRPDAMASKVLVKIAGKTVEVKHSLENGVITIELPSRITLRQGQSVEVTIV